MKKKIDIQYLAENTIEQIAEKFREDYWDSGIPVDIELIIEKELKLDLIPVSQMKRDYGVEAFISLNLKEIYYDSDIIETRIRFSMAHEVGHMILHREIINELRSDDYSGYRDKINSIPPDIIDRAEIQANSFASYLLIPATQLEERIEQFISQNKEKFNSLKPVFKNITNDNLYDWFSMDIGRTFDVSTQAANVRLKKSKYDIKARIKHILGF